MTCRDHCTALLVDQAPPQKNPEPIHPTSASSRPQDWISQGDNTLATIRTEVAHLQRDVNNKRLEAEALKDQVNKVGSGGSVAVGGGPAGAAGPLGCMGRLPAPGRAPAEACRAPRRSASATASWQRSTRRQQPTGLSGTASYAPRPSRCPSPCKVQGWAIQVRVARGCCDSSVLSCAGGGCRACSLLAPWTPLQARMHARWARPRWKPSCLRSTASCAALRTNWQPSRRGTGEHLTMLDHARHHAAAWVIPHPQPLCAPAGGTTSSGLQRWMMPMQLAAARLRPCACSARRWAKPWPAGTSSTSSCWAAQPTRACWTTCRWGGGALAGFTSWRGLVECASPLQPTSMPVCTTCAAHAGASGPAAVSLRCQAAGADA